MSLHNLANELQKKGRGKDQMLVHMTPKEVAGLQAIAKAHGGSLTVNPDTGLVEAGFLDNLLPSLLPMVAGAALASTGIGAPAAAMLVGGGMGLATGSVEKGLMAGLGAFGGAGLGETLAATNAAQAGVIPQASNAVAPGVNPVVGQAAAGQGAAPAAQGFTFDQLKTGAQNAFSSPENAGKFVSQNYGKLGMAAAPTMAAAMEPEPYQPPEKKKYGVGYSLSPDFQGYVPQRPNPYYTPTGLGYADGGLMDVMMARGGSFDDQPGVDGYKSGGTPKAKPTGERNLANMEALDATMAELNNARYGANMAQTALPKSGIAQLGNIPYTVTAAQGGQLGGYSDGGRMLRGPGDGMSDSIPATISGKQPARLADGEFVVPADVVSHLGNGSTDAGAKQLYAMMDKVRQARTGKKAQAKAVNPKKVMPA